jgi:lysyl-tRNA synthetase class 2
MSVIVSDQPATPATSGDWESSRRDKLRRIAETGRDPWGSRFDNHTPIGSIRSRADEILFRHQDGRLIALPNFGAPDFDFRKWLAEQGPGEMKGPKVRAAGRIVLHRDKGKLQFIDIRDMTGQIQLFVGQQQVGDDWQLAQCLDLGDIIGVDGELRRTKTGELSIFAERLTMLSKSLAAPPEKHHGLTDPELRHRLRYLDLTYGEGVMQRFLNRTKIVRSIRETLASRDYVEVEGPTLHSIAGGAAARPFKTHHNALDIDLYLRIALELHLKRLMVGGMERVYELGRVYRNEGISQRHNPEFTMLEAYQAYGDYRTMMDLTEACIVNAIKAIDQPLSFAWGDTTIDFTPPFERVTYDEVVARHTGVNPTSAAEIEKYAKSIGLETVNKHPDVIKSEVFETKVEKALAGPTFVLDYPASICPLTKRKADNPAVAERFELIIQGMEIANAYTELNDPDLQEQLFKTQLQGLADEESMAKMDQDFVRALRHGMPPAGGLGLGIDRLVMLLTNTQSIRDVILFPLLRPEFTLDLKHVIKFDQESNIQQTER